MAGQPAARRQAMRCKGPVRCALRHRAAVPSHCLCLSASLPAQPAACLALGNRYGTASECLAHGVPLAFLRRDYFNEEPFLRKLLEVWGCGGVPACL